MGWNDVGTWEALHDLFPKDKRGNVFLSRTLDRGSRGSLVYAQDRLVASIGLARTIVVDTPGATVVCPRDRVQEVKDLVVELQRQNMVESMQHPSNISGLEALDAALIWSPFGAGRITTA